ncbi:hypothetical protein [Streptomyces sp. NPDC057702]|uniref:hypothetical protein n=1 Tax=unclassified Streptomyces TaxID=2593676 RepID=UPI0036B0A771
MSKRRSLKTARKVFTKTGVIARAGLFLILAVVALGMGVPNQSAQALFDSCDFTEDSHNHHADFPGSGSEAMIPAMKQWQGDSSNRGSDWDNFFTGDVELPGDAQKYTVYELAGMRGLNWSMTQRNRKEAQDPKKGDGGWFGDAHDGESCSWTNEIQNDIAQFMFEGTKLFSRISISIKEYASATSPLSPLYNGTVEPYTPTSKDEADQMREMGLDEVGDPKESSAVQRLNHGVFRKMVPVMIVLTGIWALTRLRRGDMRAVWAGVAWAAAVAIGVTAFLVDQNQVRFVAAADKWVAQGNAALMEVVLGSATGSPEAPCDVGDVPNRGVRVSSCAMYDTMVFRPWAIGQFGGPGKGVLPYKGDELCYFGDDAKSRCKDLRVRHLMAQAVTHQDNAGPNFQGKDPGNMKCEWRDKSLAEENPDLARWFDLGDDSKASRLDSWKECQWVNLRILVAKEYPATFDQWRGSKPGSRLSIATYSIIASLFVGVMVIVLSFLTLLWHAVTLILVILLPLVATIAMHPAQQKLLKGWLETFAHSFVLRAGFGVILTIQLFFYQIILTTGAPLLLQLLMLILVTIAIVKMLKNLIAGKFSPQIAGADDATGIKETGNALSNSAVAKGEKLVGSMASKAGRVSSSVATGAVKGTAKGVAGAASMTGGAVATTAKHGARYGLSKTRFGHDYENPAMAKLTGRWKEIKARKAKLAMDKKHAEALKTNKRFDHDRELDDADRERERLAPKDAPPASADAWWDSMQERGQIRPVPWPPKSGTPGQPPARPSAPTQPTASPSGPGRPTRTASAPVGPPPQPKQPQAGPAPAAQPEEPERPRGRRVSRDQGGPDQPRGRRVSSGDDGDGTTGGGWAPPN